MQIKQKRGNNKEISNLKQTCNGKKMKLKAMF